MELNKTYKRPYKGTQEQIIRRVKSYCKLHNLSYTNLQVFNGYVTFTGYSNITYDNLVNDLVREKYSESAEFAILRKAINGINDEYTTYNAYVEQCKAKAKEWVTNRDNLLGV